VSRNGFYGGVRLLWAICAKVRMSLLIIRPPCTAFAER
jgi:hypothetical protein